MCTRGSIRCIRFFPWSCPNMSRLDCQSEDITCVWERHDLDSLWAVDCGACYKRKQTDTKIATQPISTSSAERLSLTFMPLRCVTHHDPEGPLARPDPLPFSPCMGWCQLGPGCHVTFHSLSKSGWIQPALSHWPRHCLSTSGSFCLLLALSSCFTLNVSFDQFHVSPHFKGLYSSIVLC